MPARKSYYTLSMDRIAESTGLAYGTVRDALRNERNPKIKNALLIARCLGLTLDDIWGKDKVLKIKR